MVVERVVEFQWRLPMSVDSVPPANLPHLSHCGRHQGCAHCVFHCSLRSDRAETLWLALVMASTNSGLVIFDRPLISSRLATSTRCALLA